MSDKQGKGEDEDEDKYLLKGRVGKARGEV